MNTQILFLLLAALLSCCYAGDPRCPESNDPEVVLHFPHPTDCGKYLTCNWGNLVEQLCPRPLLWNDDRKYCDHAFNVNCAGSSVTTEPSNSGSTDPSPATGTTPAAPSFEECPEQYNPDHPVFLPHSDCSKFYICSWGGAAFEKNCPAGLEWNVNQNYCDYPELAGCTAGSTAASSEGPTDSVTSPATATVTGALADDCPTVYDPDHQVYFPHADCTKYYICTYEGTKLEGQCPPQLHWAQHLSYCEIPAVAQCGMLIDTVWQKIPL